MCKGGAPFAITLVPRGATPFCILVISELNADCVCSHTRALTHGRNSDNAKTEEEARARNDVKTRDYPGGQSERGVSTRDISRRKRNTTNVRTLSLYPFITGYGMCVSIIASSYETLTIKERNMRPRTNDINIGKAFSVPITTLLI